VLDDVDALGEGDVDVLGDGVFGDGDGDAGAVYVWAQTPKLKPEIAAARMSFRKMDCIVFPP